MTAGPLIARALRSALAWVLYEILGTIPSKSASKLTMLSMPLVLMRVMEVQSVKLNLLPAYWGKSLQASLKTSTPTLRIARKGAVSSPRIILPTLRAISGLLVRIRATVTASSNMSSEVYAVPSSPSAMDLMSSSALVWFASLVLWKATKTPVSTSTLIFKPL